MSLRDELLAPIPGANPAGVDLRYDPVYDKIKEARREDDDAPQGEWTTERKTADWSGVIKLTKDVLANKTKDLQLGAWLTEALIHREGFAGLTQGLDVLAGLVEQFWDGLFPEIDDGDAEMRAAPLDWVGMKLEIPVRMIALDRGGFNSFQYKESRLVPNEAAANESTEKGNARKAAIEAGKPTPEEIESAFMATPKAWMKTLVAEIDAARGALKALDQVSKEKFADAAPSFSRLRDALDELYRVATQQLKRKLEIDPDPIEVVAAAPEDYGDGTAAGGVAGAGSGPLAAEPVSHGDAASRIVSAARYLRQTEPFNPAAYLILRGFRWGELRMASGDSPDPKLLEAPPTHVRTALKGMLLDARWPELLEMSESVMGSPQGRGWLDLQRYTLTACEALGSEYFAVAAAMRGALRSLLADLPQLLNMTMMDDTPTANAETRAWLRAKIVLDGEAPTMARESGAFVAMDDSSLPGHDPFPAATAEAKAGRSDRAISMLMREVSRQKTSRARFMHQVQLARIMVEAGHDAVAMPVLEQLLADIDSHKLEEWEAGDIVAAPLALLYRALEHTDGDSSTRHALYLRICRLDPLQAISFTQS